MKYRVITSNSELKDVCQMARHAAYIALDTEFIRTRTYYPQLGLIQLYDGHQVSLIDPLMISDWSQFKALLIDKKISKLLHASGEDLEVFLHEYGLLPSPFIDTQVLAAFNGRTLSCGFATLVAEYLQVELDKSETRTDWLARPLSEKQCEYAAADVFYLLPLAEKLLKETAEKGWLAAAIEECKIICQRRQEVVESQRAYVDMVGACKLMPRQLAVLQKLASWRLNFARQKDIAVNFVVRGEHLISIAQAMPDSLYELEQLGVARSEIRVHGKTLLALVNEARQLDEECLPEAIIRLTDHALYKKAFKALKEVILAVSAESGLNPTLLAPRRQIDRLLSWHWQQSTAMPELLTGWRAALFGSRLKACLAEFS